MENEEIKRVIDYFCDYHNDLGELYLVVYHVKFPNAPIQKRKIAKGFPQLPFWNLLTAKEITDPDELRYDFCFEPFEDSDTQS